MSVGGIVRTVAAATIALLATGCLYTDGINGEPQARISKRTAGPHHIGDTVTMEAFQSTDPDHDFLRASWVAVQCVDAAGTNCPPTQERTIGTRSTTAASSFTFEVEEKTPVLVTLTVSDERGATTQDWMFVEVQNRDPEVTVQRQPVGTSYTLGTSVRVVAEGTDADGDSPLFYSAVVLPPRGSLPDNARFEVVAEVEQGTTWELEPDVAGLWVVEVTVRDGISADAGQVIESLPILFVDDVAPCIVGMEPLAVPGASYIVDTAGGVRRFAVTNATDDLDPYPAGVGGEQAESTFRWFIASPDTNGQFVEVTANQGPDYVVDPSAYAPGDMLKIRVEIADRIDRGALPCSDDLATCSYTGDASCPQRLTWEAEIR